MPNILDAWMADRARGAGKVVYATAATPSTAVGIGGLIGAGTSSPPAGPSSLILPEAGTLIPPRGSADRSSYFIGLEAAVGFDGNTALHGWAPTPAATSFSMFVFLNYGVMNIVGFIPNPLQGCFYSAGYSASPTFTDPNAISLFASTTGTNPSSSINVLSGEAGGPPAASLPSITWPEDLGLSSGWIPVMFSYKLVSPTSAHAQIVVADTVLYNNSFASSSGYPPYEFSFNHDLDDTGNFMKWIGDNGSSSNGAPSYVNNDGAVVAMTQLVVYEGHYIDWSNPATRYKFFTYDSFDLVPTYTPVDIGKNGSKAIGKRPTLYLAGGPTDFLYNRAQGGLKLTQYTANLSNGLILIDDPPT